MPRLRKLPNYKFVQEIRGYDHFEMVFHPISYPLTVAAVFDRVIAVTMAGCPQIHLLNGDTKVCISHIGDVKFCPLEHGKEYHIQCNDYTANIREPIDVEVIVKAWKGVEDEQSESSQL